MRLRVLFSLFVALSSSAVLVAAPSAEQLSAQLATELEPLVKAHAGQVAVMVKHFPTGATWEIRADAPQATASLIKFPIMVAAYEAAEAGRIDLNKRITFEEADRVPGSGILTQHFTPGMTLTVRDAVRLMIAYSDNIATNLVLRELGLEATNQLMARWEFPETRVHAFVFRGETSIAPERSRQYGFGSTTAREMLRLLEKLQREELVSKSASQAMCRHLLACEDRSRLGRLLPEGTKIALKTGSVNAARTVAGIVESPAGPFAICVLTAENQDRRWSEENAALRLSAELTHTIWRILETTYAAPGAPVPTVTTLALGARGELVEDLQRTLNARANPSPGLSVDGEFGSVTQAAIQAWQRAAGLEPTGVIDARNWQALGPLVPKTEAPAIEEPPSKRPADPLDGVPFVSAKAWCIGDPETGAIQLGDEADTPRDIASTTKIMTAYLVLQLAAVEPGRLSERVTFSLNADQTIGSTAGIRAGESATVAEVLYGLMLPSGNDAATALSEHCGDWLPVDASTPGQTAAERFIAAMNATARTLEMTRSRYVNPHGLTHRDHKSTAADQFRLARAALQLPRFRELIQTRQYRCEVTGAEGYRRPVVWRNTNQLLGIEGYAGVKTGTTDAAGACLIALSQRDHREAVLVVLGSSSSDGRYVDSRNLFRYYWRTHRAGQ